MGEKESNSAGVSLQGNDLSYQKLGHDTRTLPDLHYMENDDVPTSTLELEWDMETELEELGTEQFQSDGFIHDHEKNSTAAQLHTSASNQLSISPKGRFQRLEEEPEYLSHYTESKPKTSQQLCTIVKTFSIFMFTFLIGILIGYFAKRSPNSNSCIIPNEVNSSNEVYIIDEIIKNLTKENIEQHYRYFTQISVNKTNSDQAKNIALLWTSIGLNEVELVNYSVLLDLPGSSPNTITLNNGQCYYPSGQQCDEETRSQEFLYTYTAYSANGTLEGEVIDVQYGTVEDLQKVTKRKNISNNSIALLKLGYLPLLYKLSLLEETGFGGVLIYIDPCDVPEAKSHYDREFMVSLKNEGFPFKSSDYDGNFWEIKSNVTSLLVQPVTILLLRRLFTWAENTKAEKCLHIKIPETEQVEIMINIKSVEEDKEISNCIGFLRGSLLPDRYIILGSPHADAYGRSTQEWVSGAAVMTSIIGSVMLKVKTGWRPQRTIVFCSWGGKPFGNFGSYKWGKDLHRILAGNAVAYIGLQNPVRRNGSLYSISSPSLHQLAAELAKKMQAKCVEKDACYKANISSTQIQGDADFFINQLGIPTAQFFFEDKAKVSHIFTEVLFNSEEKSDKQDAFFHFHEYVAKVTSEMVLRIATDPVLPFNALDIALEIQKRIEGHDVPTDLIEAAKHLRETAQLFQSNEMRPANDPQERDPIRVRMLNDILQNIEKNFLISSSPPGFFRNMLYRLDETSAWFSILEEAQEHCKITKSNETLLTALQEVLSCINSAQLYLKEGLHLFDSDLEERN